MENYEQKYKESLERCKSWMKGEHPECFSEAQKAAEFIFPELRESEDERIRKGLIKGLSAMRDIHKHQTFSDDAINIDDAIAWLEKQGEQKSTWSEEDEKMLNNCIGLMQEIDSTQEEQNWLKSLKPQKHWKPSDLQLEALESAYKQLPNIQHFLQSLYNDLKKL